MKEPTIADDIRRIPMQLITAGVFFIVFVFGGLMKPWDAVLSLLTNLGVDEKQFNTLVYMFGYTLPLSFGFFTLSYLYLTGRHREHNLQTNIFVSLAILWVCGIASKVFGLGVAPTFTLVDAYRGAVIPTLFSIVLNGYLHTYSWSLVICAITLGVGFSIWVERKTHKFVDG